jgi:hypothetical protein
MRTIPFTTVRFVLTAGAGVVLSIGCASPPKEPAPSDYVFFGGYPNLKRISAARGVFLYANPKKPLREYRKFIVDPSAIYFQPGSAYWINQAKSDELASFFRQEVVASLSDSYQIVENPGPGVLRMSLTLGDVRLRQGDGEHQPVLRIMLSDSDSGEEVLLLRDITRGGEFADAIEKRGDAGAKELLHEWARLLRDKIDEARRTDASAPPSTRPEKE